MQNVVINMCEKFHSDPLRNARALGNGNQEQEQQQQQQQQQQRS